MPSGAQVWGNGARHRQKALGMPEGGAPLQRIRALACGPRRGLTAVLRERRFCNAAMHTFRMRVERTFAWEDQCKRLLLRFERIQQRHYGMKLMA